MFTLMWSVDLLLVHHKISIEIQSIHIETFITIWQSNFMSVYTNDWNIGIVFIFIF